MKNDLSNVLRDNLSQNIIAMYCIQASRYLLPLIYIPYLARVLGVSSWGALAFAQAFALYASLIVDYGFELSATREVAKNRNNPEALSEIVAGVLGAKIALSGITIILGLALQGLVPIFAAEPLLLWMGIFWGLTQAFNLYWFFQGIERLKVVASIDIATKLLGLAAIIILVRSPADAWMVLAINGTSSLILFGVMLAIIYSKVKFRLPQITAARYAIGNGWNAFLIRGGSSLYTIATPFLIGLFSSTEIVGYFSAAERIARVLREAVRPVTRVLYSRINYLIGHDIKRAAHHARVLLVALASFGFVVSASIVVFAPWVVGWIFGPGFEPAVPILRVLSVLAFITAIGNVLGIQWMLPNGLDRQLVQIILLSNAFFVVLAIIFIVSVPVGVGIALAVVVTEAIVAGLCFLALVKADLDPFRTR